MKRFNDQLEGRAKRAYSEGRLKPSDDGDIAFAIAADREKGVVILDFGKQVSWLGMRPKDAVALAEKLIEKAREVANEPLTFNL